MSTKFTNRPQPLTVLLSVATGAVLSDLRARLLACGYDGITDSHLVLFGHLDCGATHAALIAQRMGVSRQAISKTLREMETLGILRLAPDPDRGNQKLVVMTEAGERLATDARAALAGIEADLATRIGPEAWPALRNALERCWPTRT